MDVHPPAPNPHGPIPIPGTFQSQLNMGIPARWGSLQLLTDVGQVEMRGC